MTHTTNQLAIKALENNDYDASLLLFKQAVEESRDIQSLNNLAYLYLSEGIRKEDGSWEDGEASAIKLLKECLTLTPASHFPYNMLGEAYLNLECWQEALDILEKSIALEPSTTSYHNAAAAAYHLQNIEKAANYYAMAAETSEYAKYMYAYCLIKLNQFQEATRVLEELTQEIDDYIGDVEIADLYMEMKQYHLAVSFFEKGWSSYAKDPVWVDRFIYALIQTGQNSKAQESIDEIIRENIRLIEEIRTDTDDDENWTEADREERIQELLAENSYFQKAILNISYGTIPPLHVQTSVLSECYWFGCARHGNPEYGD